MRQRRAGRSSINVLQGLFYVAKVSVCLLLDLMREPWPMGRLQEEEPVKPAPTPIRQSTPHQPPATPRPALVRSE